MPTSPARNLVITWDAIVTAIQGQGRVQSVRLKNLKTNQEQDYPCDGVFIFVGMVPSNRFSQGHDPVDRARVHPL